MSALAELLIRVVLAGFLLLVILASFQGLRMLFVPSRGFQIRTFEVERGGEVKPGESNLIAKKLRSKFRRIEKLISKDVRSLAESSAVSGDDPRVTAIQTPGQVTAQVQTSPVLPESRLPQRASIPSAVVTIGPIQFEAKRLLTYIEDALFYRGTILEGTVVINGDDTNLIAECYESKTRTQLQYWEIQTKAGLDEAIDDLAHAVFQHIHRDSLKGKLSFSNRQDFRQFVRGLERFQDYLVSAGRLTGDPGEQYLDKVLALWQPLAARDPEASLLYAYLGSLHTIRDEPEQAVDNLVRAAQLNPADDFAKREIERLQPLVDAIIQARSMRPVMDEKFGGLLLQLALLQIRAGEAIEAAGSGSDVTVAIVATGAPKDEELRRRFLESPSFVESEPSVDDENGYGTWISSVVAAIAPNAKILPIKALDSRGAGRAADITRGLEFVAETGADIVLLGYGSRHPFQRQEDLLSVLHQNGMLLIGASGNEGSMEKYYPGAYSEVISIAATNDEDQLTDFSNYGPWVRLSAPGSGITSLGPDGVVKRSLSGTAFSSAIAAGVAALVLSVRNDLSPEQVEQVLVDSAVRLPGSKGGEPTPPRIDALAAVELAKRMPSDTGR